MTEDSERYVERDPQWVDCANEALLAAAKMVWLLVVIGVGLIVLVFVTLVIFGMTGVGGIPI